MIIKYFAWLKNITNTEEEVIDNENIKDVKTLKKFLLNKYPELNQYFNEDDIIRIAINLEYITTNKPINSKDEIALFPPVSGG